MLPIADVASRLFMVGSGRGTRMAEFDPNHLQSLMVAAFERLGQPEAQELARAILKAAERPQSGDPGSPDRDPTRRLG
jgi:hypothetical protein